MEKTIRKMNQLPEQSFLMEILSLDAEAGRLFWKERPKGMFPSDQGFKSWNATYSGKEAFTYIGENGYKKGTLFTKTFFAHRIIWKMAHGTEPEFIDHKNGVRSDNRPDNLRSVSGAENMKNKGIGKNNTSGFLGVRYRPSQRKWTAEIRVDGKKTHIGSFLSLEKAAAARETAEILFGFYPGHGGR